MFFPCMDCNNKICLSCLRERFMQEIATKRKTQRLSVKIAGDMFLTILYTLNCGCTRNELSADDWKDCECDMECQSINSKPHFYNSLYKPIASRLFDMFVESYLLNDVSDDNIISQSSEPPDNFTCNIPPTITVVPNSPDCSSQELNDPD